jgi:hypothetical protein
LSQQDSRSGLAALYHAFSLAVWRTTANLFAVQSLTPPDSYHLEAAQGWLELGNHLEANEELEKISPALRIHPDNSPPTDRMLGFTGPLPCMN